MKRAVIVLLCGSTLFIAGYFFRARSVPATPQIIGDSGTPSERKADFKLSDISRFEWVDKRCRMWAPDGDIDVDQTCLVITTGTGGLVVMPNEANDEWVEEMADSKTPNDKWIQRFFAVGGGVK